MPGNRRRKSGWLWLLLTAGLVVVAGGIFLKQSQTVMGNPPTLGGCPMFPADNIWNVPVDKLPTASKSADYIANMSPSHSLHADFGSGTWEGAPIGIPFKVVPQNQAPVTIQFGPDGYPGESDPGPYPAPLDAPIEGDPNLGGDRHVLVLQEGTCKLYEMYRAFPNSNSWTIDSGAVYTMTSNLLRTDGWTSADAAGLPILPGLVRWDEVDAGAINHAIRFTTNFTRNSHIWPARHDAGSQTSDVFPAMGQRFRLKASFDISSYPQHVKVILQAMKTYGLILADNGSDWYISGAPDATWNDDELVTNFAKVHGSDFEAVDVSSILVNSNSGQAAMKAPVLSAVVASPPHGINLNWTDNSVIEDGFNVERQLNSQGNFSPVITTAANTVAFQDTNLPDGATYTYRVRAFNSWGNSAYSNLASATLPLLAPTNLTTTAVLTHQINLGWTDASINESGYIIERSTQQNSGFTPVGQTAANANSYQDTGLVDATLYYYRVRAFNSVTQSTSVPISGTTKLDLPTAPGALFAWATSNTAASLVWTDNSHTEDNFYIERSLDLSFTTIVSSTIGPNVTSGSDSGLTPDTSYYYRIRAHNAVGDSYSNIVLVKTKVWLVAQSTDDGQGQTTPVDKLSYVNAHATTGQTVNFAVPGNIITFSQGSNWTPQLTAGVNFVASCNTPVTINGGGLTSSLQLNHNILIGLTITGFRGPEIAVPQSGVGNRLQCVKAITP